MLTPPSQIEPPEISLRVPGPWWGPDDLIDRLPAGYELRHEDDHAWLYLPDGERVPLAVCAADDEFPTLFAQGCAREPSETDKHGIEEYRFNICPIFPGGSFERAAAALRHTVALLDAGGHGVFVDNCGIAHGSDDWRDLAEDTGPDGGGPFWAFVLTIRSTEEMWTIGMHCLGYRDAVMPRTGNDEFDNFRLRNFLGYSYRSGAVIEDGHVAGTEDAPMFRIHVEEDVMIPPGHPMHNPYGRYRLEPMMPRPSVEGN